MSLLENNEDEWPKADDMKYDEPNKPTPSQKSRLVTYQFTREQEAELASWYREHPCLYDKKLNSYKDYESKMSLIEEKAATFTPPCSCEYFRFNEYR